MPVFCIGSEVDGVDPEFAEDELLYFRFLEDYQSSDEEIPPEVMAVRFPDFSEPLEVQSA